MRAALVTGLVLALSACGGSEPPEPRPGALETAEPGDEAGSTRASREGAEIAAAPPEEIAVAPTATPAVRPLFVAHPIDAARGEDGHGAVVAATDAIALDLDARRFPPRALDPVVTIGELRFVHYEHPHPGLMRFVVASRASLPEGAPVAIQYGDDASTRTVLTDALAIEGSR